jgi:hypothetical protein
MTVKELIERLIEFPQDYEIRILDDDREEDYSFDDREFEVYEEYKQVVIE